MKNVKPVSIFTASNELNKNIWFIAVGGTGNGLTGETIDNAQNNGGRSAYSTKTRNQQIKEATRRP